MIKGIGVDFIEVGRIQKTINNYGEQFLNRIFTNGEQLYCSRKPHSAQHYAARFAAKEAFSKALGTGIMYKFSWKDVEVTRHPSGKPIINYTGYFKNELKQSEIFLTLTHTADHAMAVVVIEESAK